MKALLLFHFRAGVRLGLRASAAIAAAMVAWIILQDSGQIVALVIDLARGAFAVRPAIVDVAPIVGLAFLLPAWASGRLSAGLNGWLRHLPISGADNRHGLTLALVSVQFPLVIVLILSALLTRPHPVAVALSGARWLVVLTAGAAASLPVERRTVVIPIAIAAAALALLETRWYMLIAAALLLMVGGTIGGPLSRRQRLSPWHTPGPVLHWMIAWRSLGVRVFVAYGWGLVAIAANWLFLHNNGLAGGSASGPVRLASVTASVLCLFSLTKMLALYRQVWPLARSFPWSAAHRVALDGLFLGGHALPLVGIAAFQNPTAALAGVSLLPFLSLRAAGYIARIPDEPRLALVFLMEGLMSGIVLTLLPWTAFVWLAASPLALLWSTERERRRKVTKWSEWQAGLRSEE